MSKGQERTYNKGRPLDGHERPMRHKAVKEILRDKSKQITTLPHLAKELAKNHNIQTDPSTLSRDMNALNFKKVNEDGVLCYRMPDTAEAEITRNEIRDICKAAGITNQSIAQEIKTLYIRTNGYSHLLSEKLKKLYPSRIVDTQPLENILIVYYIGRKNAPDSYYDLFADSLAEIMTGKKARRKASDNDTEDDTDMPPAE